MKKCAVFFLFFLTALLPLSVQASDFSFTDVEETAWYYNDVKTAWESGLINGSTPTEFAPDDNVTWAETIKLAACMHQLYTEGEVTLIGGDPWYETYAEYAFQQDIIPTKDSFDPDAPIERGRFIEIFSKALPADALTPINEIPDGALRDVPMSYLNSKAIYKLYRAGVIQGSGENHSFYPSRYITRGEVAAILTRMMNAEARISFTIEQPENTEYKAAYADFLTTYVEKYGKDGEEYGFDLIYVDSDDIPELVVAEKSVLGREDGVRVWRYIADHVSAIGTYGGYGSMTYFPHNGLLWDSISGGTSDGWTAQTALKTPENPPETILVVQEAVNHQTQTTEYRMFLYGDVEWTTLTKEEYDAQHHALEDFRETESVSVTSQGMYELNEENITKVLG